MINIELLDELENNIRSESGSVEEFLDSDCRNEGLANFYNAKYYLLEHMMDNLKGLLELVEDYNGLEPSEYD